MSELTTQSGSKYTDEDRRNAAMEYVMKGSLTAVERSTNIPKTTLSDWKQTEWWNELAIQAEALVEERIRAGANSIVDRCINETLDRVENGDHVLDKEGNIKRVPMKGRDAAVVGAMWYDKRRLSLNLPTSISSSSGHKKLMDDLAAEFKRLSEQNRRVVSVQDSGESEISTGDEPNP